MNRYFAHVLKKYLGLLLFLTLFCVIVYIAPLMKVNFSDWNHYEWLFFKDGVSVPLPSLHLWDISTMLILIALFLPVVLFSYKMNKRSVDLYYALPLPKRKILLVHFLVGLILLYVPYTAAYFLGFAFAAANIRHAYLIFYLYLYLASLIPAFTIYSVTTFVFTRANTIWDGIIAAAGVVCLVTVVVAVIEPFSGIEPTVFFPFSTLEPAAEKFEDAVFRGKIKYPFGLFDAPNQYTREREICVLVSGIIWTLISIAMTVALFWLEPHSRAENCGQISKSFFCYKTLLPLYTFLISFCFSVENPPSLYIVAFAAYAIAVIYKRSFRIGWKLGVVLLCCLLAGFGFSFFTYL